MCASLVLATRPRVWTPQALRVKLATAELEVVEVQRLEAAGKSLNLPVTVVRYDALESGAHQAFAVRLVVFHKPDADG